MSIFERAWKRLQERLNEKTSWGRNELVILMSECLQDAVTEVEQEFSG